MAYVLRAWGILAQKEDAYVSQEGLDTGENGRVAGYHTGDGSVDLKKNPSIKSRSGGWKACPFILGNECCERLTYYGIAMNLVVYLTKVLHQENATASNNVTNWSGTCYITPLIGGFLADAFWGRYWTITLFSAIYFVGTAVLTLTALLPTLNPPACVGNSCPKASSTQIGVFYLALYLIALGTGGIKPCVSSFGADQFDETDEDDGKKKASFFNWFYFSINVGALIAASALVYIQDNLSWALGFGIPAVFMSFAIFFYLMGTPLYRHQTPSGSPLTRIAQVLVAATRNWQVSPAKDLYEVDDKESLLQGRRKLEHTRQFRFFDKAATVTGVGSSGEKAPSKWRLCTISQVEEVKVIIRILPIWATTIVFSTVYSQMSTLFVLQGERMDAHMGPNFTIPAASLTIFDTLSVLMWVPMYDRILVPLVRKRTGNERGFTQIQRMGIGLVISILAMVAAAVVEIERLKTATRHGLVYDDDTTPVPISIFWQIPQYFLIGAAEVFLFIGQMEFFYDQSPDTMRSLGSALSLTTVALGNYLSSLLVTVVTRITKHGNSPGWIPQNINVGHIDYFFWLLAVLSFLNFLGYLWVGSWYQYKNMEMGAISSLVPHVSSLGMSDSTATTADLGDVGKHARSTGI